MSHLLQAHQPAPPSAAAAVGAVLRGVAARLRTRGAGLVAWLRARTPQQVLWVVLAVVLLAYVAVLITASTSTGRGGR